MADPGRRSTWAIDAHADQWMLDRWSTPEQHKVSTYYRERLIPDGAGGYDKERDYRSVCSCGWRSIEFIKPFADRCPVLDALQERIRRAAKLHEDDWRPFQ